MAVRQRRRIKAAFRSLHAKSEIMATKRRVQTERDEKTGIDPRMDGKQQKAGLKLSSLNCAYLAGRVEPKI